MGLLLTLGMLGMILDSRTAMQGASQGVTLCLTAVIPSLLPFLCLSMLLNQRLFGKRLRLLDLPARLFGLPEGGAVLLIPALLGGYPAGAACVAQAARRGQLSIRDGEILLGFCSLPGPAFVLGLVGRQFSDPLAGVALWAVALLSALAVARLLPGRSGRASAAPEPSADPLGQAGAAVGKICVTVILFRVLLNFLSVYLPLDGTILVAVQGLLELTNGCCALASIPSEDVRFVLAAALISFGGLCVGLQTAQVCPRLRLGYYQLGKLLQGTFSGLLAWLLVKRQFVILGLAVFFLIFLLPKVAFWGAQVYNRLNYPSGRKLCFSERK